MCGACLEWGQLQFVTLISCSGQDAGGQGEGRRDGASVHHSTRTESAEE